MNQLIDLDLITGYANKAQWQKEELENHKIREEFVTPNQISKNKSILNIRI